MLFYTLKLKQQVPYLAESAQMAPEIVNILWQYAAGLLKGGVASLEPLPVS